MEKTAAPSAVEVGTAFCAPTGPPSMHVILCACSWLCISGGSGGGGGVARAPHFRQAKPLFIISVHKRLCHPTWGAFQYQKISLPKMSFGLVQSGWGESECFCKNLAPGSCEVFKDIFRAYRNAPLAPFIRTGAPHPKILDPHWVGLDLCLQRGGNIPDAFT